MNKKSQPNAVKSSYEAQSGFYEALYQERAREVNDGQFFREDTPQAWIHHRMLQCMDPLLDALPQARWLTIGDGRFGRDAHYIESKGVSVLATDISDTLLLQAKAQAYIKDGQQQNAEAMTFGDDVFDFVLCKESYHHFPRPSIALYEMLRVASRGVVLIEPNDEPTIAGVGFITKRMVKSIMMRMGLGRLLRSQNTSIIQPLEHMFEQSGNYLFGLSARELEKAAVALACPAIACKGFDIHSDPPADMEIDRLDRESERMTRSVKSSVSRRRHGYLAAIVFWIEPDVELREALSAQGYEITNLPRNPHLAKSS